MVTLDTNVAFYALVLPGEADEVKASRAKAVFAEVDFLSVQVLNEFSNAARRKLKRSWSDIEHDVNLLRNAIAKIHPITPKCNLAALRIADRYQLSFYDALLVSVALANGATTLYSEDMHHGLVIDGTLTITDPFHTAEPA